MKLKIFMRKYFKVHTIKLLEATLILTIILMGKLIVFAHGYVIAPFIYTIF
tara:strand:+ start:210 stop:362 length:153 start_codon:yes stop_codon:yes gene_type:complete